VRRLQFKAGRGSCYCLSGLGGIVTVVGGPRSVPLPRPTGALRCRAAVWTSTSVSGVLMPLLTVMFAFHTGGAVAHAPYSALLTRLLSVDSLIIWLPFGAASRIWP